MEQAKPEKKSRWRETWSVIVTVIAYMIPLIWLWEQTGYPDEFGIHVTAHGKAGLLENWWYSDLLLERHRIVDIVTFAYMWAAVVGIVAWLGWAVVKDRRAKQMALLTENLREKGDDA
jgi:hypothetical protein